MGEKIQQLKSCILDLRNKIEVAEEKIRRATKALGIKQQRCEMLWEDATYKRRKLAIKKEKLKAKEVAHQYWTPVNAQHHAPPRKPC